MSSLNEVNLIGSVGQNPDIITTEKGKLAKLSLATTETWVDKNGEKQQRTEWHKIIIYTQGLVNLCEKYIQKASKIYVKGKLQTKKYVDKNGIEKYSTEIVLNGFDNKIVLLQFRQNTSSNDEEINEEVPF